MKKPTAHQQWAVSGISVVPYALRSRAHCLQQRAPAGTLGGVGYICDCVKHHGDKLRHAHCERNPAPHEEHAVCNGIFRVLRSIARQSTRKKMKRHVSPYRKVLERTLFVLASAGIMLTAHLSFWYGGAVVDPVCSGESDCASVIALDPTLFGLSSTTSGLLFYLLAAALTLGVAMDFWGKRQNLKAARFILVGAGLLYSLFLTLLQLFALEDYCVLCLASFGLVAAMTGLLLVMAASPGAEKHRRGQATHPQKMNFFGIIGTLILVAVVADYTWYKSKAPEVGMAASANTSFNPALCGYDESLLRFENLDQFISDSDPTTGFATAPVTIVEFIDPNCPACRLQHPIMKQLAARYPQEIRIVYKPFPLLTGNLLFSLDEVMALWLAHEQGRYDDMIEAVFDAHDPAGLSVTQLSEIADDLGLDASEFRQGLESRRLESRARRTRLVFDGMGLDGVPAILINGRKVHSSDRSLGCLSYLVDQELPGVIQ